MQDNVKKQEMNKKKNFRKEQQEAFFLECKIDITNEEQYRIFQEKIYPIVHTCYLKVDQDYEAVFYDMFQSTFGVQLSKSSYKYLVRISSFLLREKEIQQLKQREKVDANYIMGYLLCMEFDLWLVDVLEQNEEYDYVMFTTYMSQKYGELYKKEFSKFKKNQLKGIVDLSKVAKKLQPFKEQIMALLDATIEANGIKVNLIEQDNAGIQNEKLEELLEQLKEKELRIQALEKDVEQYKGSLLRKEEAEKVARKNNLKMMIEKFDSDEYGGRTLSYLYLALEGKVDIVNDLDNFLSYLETVFIILENIGVEPEVINNVTENAAEEILVGWNYFANGAKEVITKPKVVLGGE